MYQLIGAILLEGMKMWNEERRNRFKTRYYNILQDIEKSTNAKGEGYSDVNIYEAKKEHEIFLKAYYSEVMEQNK